MKHKIKVLVVALMCMLISGCSTVPQPTMEELLAEVNAEHAAVEQADDFSQYLRKPLGETTFKIMQTFPFSDEEFDPQKVLTLEQATEDVDYLFTLIRCTIILVEKKPLQQHERKSWRIVLQRSLLLVKCLLKA